MAQRHKADPLDAECEIEVVAAVSALRARAGNAADLVRPDARQRITPVSLCPYMQGFGR
jgi:hypothetical protein